MATVAALTKPLRAQSHCLKIVTVGSLPQVLRSPQQSAGKPREFSRMRPQDRSRPGVDAVTSPFGNQLGSAAARRSILFASALITAQFGSDRSIRSLIERAALAS